MADDIVINGETYSEAESVVLYDTDGYAVQFYSSAVLYTPQELTEDQKAQARENIGAHDTEALNDITRNMERIVTYSGGSVNLIDQSACAFGYVGIDGVISESTSLKYTPHIPVSEGDVIRFYRVENDSTGAVILKNIRFVTAYDADGNAVSDSGANNPDQLYTVPAGIASIVLTFSALYKWCFTKNTEIAVFVPYDPDAVGGSVVSYVAKPEFVGMANETKPGLVRVWTEAIDNEIVLHISNEEV